MSAVAKTFAVEVWWGGRWVLATGRVGRKAYGTGGRYCEALVLDPHAQEWCWVNFDKFSYRKAKDA